MINKKTVLILGAGASWDYGFPIGMELRNQICRRIRKGPHPALGHHWGHNQLTAFANDLLQSRISVDAFLEKNPEYLGMGKFAIASTLLPCEVKSFLYSYWLHPEHQRMKDKNHWYDILFGKMIDGADFDNFKDNKLSVITFNYDRSFEQFLFTSFRSSHPAARENEDECAKQVSSIEVVHVYGSLGRLSWQPDSGLLEGVPEVGYSAVNRNNLPSQITTIGHAASSIYLMRDGPGDTPAFTKAKKLLQQAERIYILGFGFNMTNLERLDLLDPNFMIKQIVGTCKGLDIHTKEFIHQRPHRKNSSIDGYRFHLKDQSIYEFLHTNEDSILS